VTNILLEGDFSGHLVIYVDVKFNFDFILGILS